LFLSLRQWKQWSDPAGLELDQPLAVSPVSPCDIKQNGNLNVADVQLIVNEALGVTQAVDDLSGDGAVSVVDIQIEINAALKLGCTAK